MWLLVLLSLTAIVLFVMFSKDSSTQKGCSSCPNAVAPVFQTE